MPYRVELMNETAAWPLSEIAAQQINRLRKHYGWSRDFLAEKCRDLGAPDNMTGAAIANIETGRPDSNGRRRRDITIDELVIFALALDVAPLVLMFPVGQVKSVEVLPGKVRPTWLAAKWFTGEEPWCGESDDEGRWYADFARLGRWRQNSAGSDFYRMQDRRVREWDEALSKAEDARDEANRATDDVTREATRRRAEAFEATATKLAAVIGQLRWSARRQGLLPPTLPKELAYVDDEEQTR